MESRAGMANCHLNCMNRLDNKYTSNQGPIWDQKNVVFFKSTYQYISANPTL